MTILIQGPTATITDDQMHGDDGRGYLEALPAFWEQLALTAESAGRRDSATPHNSSLGLKIFECLPNGVEWPLGLGIQVLDKASSEGRSLFGKVVSHDRGDGLVSIQVTGQSESGSWNASEWALFVVGRYEHGAPAPAPGTVAEGMTGATTPAGARDNLELFRSVKVRSLATAPPLDAATGERFLLVDAQWRAVPCSGAFAGHRGELATRQADGSYVFEAPPTSEAIAVFDLQSRTVGTYSAGAGWASADPSGLRPAFRWLSGFDPSEEYPIDLGWLEPVATTVNFALSSGQAPRALIPSGAREGALLRLCHRSGPAVTIKAPSGATLGTVPVGGHAVIQHDEQDDWYVVGGLLA